MHCINKKKLLVSGMFWSLIAQSFSEENTCCTARYLFGRSMWFFFFLSSPLHWCLSYFLNSAHYMFKRGYRNEEDSWWLEQVSMASRPGRDQLSFIPVRSLNFTVLLMRYLRATSAKVLIQQFLFQHLGTDDLFLSRELSIFKTESNYMYKL